MSTLAMKPDFIRKFQLSNIKPPVFYRNLTEIKEAAGYKPYTHLMKRAWEEIKLDGIYCVEGKPVVYFKEAANPNEWRLKQWHRTAWNQGLATLLVVSTQTDLLVFSTLVPPAQEKELIGDNNRRLATILKTTTDCLEFLQSVETGHIYNENPRSFDPDKSVDKTLLGYLSKTRDMLKSGKTPLPVKDVHALLGRIIFTTYLTDRKIINERQFEKAGAPGKSSIQNVLNDYPPEQASEILNNLFELLQDYFNGSMFERKRINLKEIHITILKSFLNVADPDSTQLQLFQWSYDFRVIPVETISSIYEEFLKEESEKGQRKSGAYYTPKYLAEMVVDTAIKGWDTLLDKKVLDPSCGSGIFLVILFNRMAEEWNRRNPKAQNITRANALKSILQTNICGIDINLTACRVTCFSLYLAFLDQLRPNDIHELHEKYGPVLPPLLMEKKADQESENFAIFENNFFSSHMPIKTDFDLVIGNPPWVGRGQPTDPEAIKWYSDESHNPFLHLAPASKQVRKSFFMPQNQTAHAFMWKAPQHVTHQGRVCLLLPSKVLFNKTDEFQQGWFSRFTVEQVLLLSDMRFVLFENAICPAVILKYRAEEPEEGHEIHYEAPKVNRYNPDQGVISIEAHDCKYIKQESLLSHAANKTASVLWKTNFWGTDRDSRLLERLRDMPSLERIVGTPNKPKR